MHLSQFDKSARLDEAGRVTVTGRVAPDRDDQGQIRQRRLPVHFHFAVVKDGQILCGHAEATGNAWTGTTEAGASGLSEGPALALGLAVAFTEGQSAAFDTFAWSDELTLGR